MADSQTFKNIDHKNKTVSKPRPDRINDIDTKSTLYKNIIDSAQNGIFDLSSINSFTFVSQTRDEVYNMLDIMAQDPMIAAALQIYAADVCEPNDKGQIVWAESNDERILGMVTHLLEQLNINKNAFDWVYSFVKYGDLYLRLYRNSEYNADDELFKNEKQKNTLNEDVIIKAYKKDDHYAEYIEAVKNPAEVFDLQRFGKNVGYVRTHIYHQDTSDNLINQNTNFLRYNFNRGDVDLYQATEFVHACFTDNSNRTTEEISITNDTESTITYSVKRGKSILYDLFRIWRELTLLENSMMLNRITKSARIRLYQIEVGDMEKSDVKTLMARFKAMVEQKSAIGVGNSFEDYTNPGPVENSIYIPVHNGKGQVQTSEVGGDVQTGGLEDVDYFMDKLVAGLGIPKQYLGKTDDSTGFNGGSALSLISSQYGKTVKRMQNCFVQAITDAINLFLFDQGLSDYIGEFTIRMQEPTTQEEKDRVDNKRNELENTRTIMDMFAGYVDDDVSKLNVLKALLSEVTTNADVITEIQNRINALQEQLPEEEETSTEDTGMEDLGIMEEEPSGETQMVGTPMVSGEELPEEPIEAGEETLPSWGELGADFTTT